MGKLNRQDILMAFAFSAVQMAFFTWVVWEKQDWINTDAVSYIRIAQYYASGQFDLMISGYWGPMLSWIMVPFLGLVDDPLTAGHMAMGVSALVFLMGGMAILRVLGIGSFARLMATGIIVLFSVSWAVRFVTPDVLVSGLLCLAISRILLPEWCEKSSVQLSAGLLFGAAYLAKAVALPLSVLLIIAAALLGIIGQQTNPARVLRSVVMTIFGLMIIASPWILILSLKYERPVFSTSAEINHTVVGPSSVNRGHPTFHEFHIPEEGRVTSWEDPLPKTYARWSPLESSENMAHQLRVINSNAQSTLNLLKGSDWLGIGLVSVIFGFLFHVPWRQNIGLHRWRWSAIIIGCLAAIYLPVPGRDMRYYLATYPFLLGGSLGFVGYLVRDSSYQSKFLYILGVGLLAFSFFLPLATIPSPNPNPSYQAAKILKQQLDERNIAGPIASISESHYMALYTAFLMERPFYGNSSRAQTVEEVQSSSAKILIVDRGNLADLNMKKDTRFILLDERLFDSLSGKFKSNVNIYLNKNMKIAD